MPRPGGVLRWGATPIGSGGRRAEEGQTVWGVRLLGFERLNLVPHAHTASILPTELSPQQPSSVIFI